MIWNGIRYYIFQGEIGPLIGFLNSIFAYLLFKTYFLFMGARNSHKGHLFKEAVKLGKSTVFLMVMIFGFAFFVGGLLNAINTNANPAQIGFNDDWCMRMDKLIFGTHVPFWFQSATNIWRPFFDSLAFILHTSYGYLHFAISIIFLLVLIKNSRMFFKMSLVFMLSLLLSAPVWYYFPVLSPRPRYIENLVQVPIPPEVQTTLEQYQPNEFLRKYFAGFRERERELGERDFYWVTTIPSMHIAWGSMITYFGISLWYPLAVILIPYFVLNGISTLFLLQHYAIDIPAGVIVFGISLVLARFITNRVNTPMFIVNLTQSFQSDISLIRHFLVSLISKFRKKLGW